MRCVLSSKFFGYLCTTQPAVYVLLSAASGAAGPNDDNDDDDDAVSDSDDFETSALLLSAGVGLCVLVVLLSVAFVVHQHWRGRRLASKLTLPSTPAHEALLSRTDHQPRTDQAADNSRRQHITAAAAHDATDHSQQYDLFSLLTVSACVTVGCASVRPPVCLSRRSIASTLQRHAAGLLQLGRRLQISIDSWYTRRLPTAPELWLQPAFCCDPRDEGRLRLVLNLLCAVFVSTV